MYLVLVPTLEMAGAMQVPVSDDWRPTAEDNEAKATAIRPKIWKKYIEVYTYVP